MQRRTYFETVTEELATTIAKLRTGFDGHETILVHGTIARRVPGTRFGTSLAPRTGHDRRAVFYDADTGLFVGATVGPNKTEIRFSMGRTDAFGDVSVHGFTADESLDRLARASEAWRELAEAMSARFEPSPQR